jgi:hypothetical protein
MNDKHPLSVVFEGNKYGDDFSILLLPPSPHFSLFIFIRLTRYISESVVESYGISLELSGRGCECQLEVILRGVLLVVVAEVMFQIVSIMLFEWLVIVGDCDQNRIQNVCNESPQLPFIKLHYWIMMLPFLNAQHQFSVILIVQLLSNFISLLLFDLIPIRFQIKSRLHHCCLIHGCSSDLTSN